MVSWGRECRVRFERPRYADEADEDNRRPIVGWVLIVEVWGRKRFVREVEREEADQVRAVKTDRFRVRYRKTILSLPQDARMVCEGLVYAVDQVDELTQVDGRESRREWIVVTGRASKIDVS